MNAYGLVLLSLLVFVVVVGLIIKTMRRRFGRGFLVLPLDGYWQATYQGELTIFEKAFWRNQLLGHVRELQAIGWSNGAIAVVYLEGLNVPEDGETQEVYLEQRLLSAKSFGGQLFQDMWRFSHPYQAPKEAQSLLQIALSTLDMPEELSGDPEETKQLLTRFSPDLEPASPFWQVVARTVQVAFPGENMVKKGRLAHQVHQLRYLISSQQAQWVREHYRTSFQTDLGALIAYIRDLAERNGRLEQLGVDNYKAYFDFELTESARLHQKIAIKKAKNGQVKPVQTDGSPVNLKILLRFHTEFILDEVGHFLNELDAEQMSEAGVVNGASFNYANRNNKRHKQLDILPVKVHDPVFRKNQLRAFKAPNLSRKSQDKQWYLSYFNPEGLFSHQGKSAFRRVQQRQKEFERMLRKPPSET
ncbi:hypothetical protein ABID29_000828 [Streptococcus rupicaprae]|uniref:DUF3114 domain-containing protein n=1 Tax=Streptococcus rupicaprae TaxID=759619 RepID=A0ABV2FGP1_9STRE